MTLNAEQLKSHLNMGSIQGLIQYVKKHLAEINVSGNHAYKQNGQWRFDEEAVKVIEALRGLNNAGVIEAVADERMKERDIIINNLQTKMCELANRNDELANKYITSLEKIADLEKELRLSAEKSAQSVIAQKEISFLKKQLNKANIENSMLNDKLTISEQHNLNLNVRLAEERSKGIWAKVKEWFD